MAVALYELGCRHGHLSRSWTCQFHDRELLRGNGDCSPCSDSGHQCPLFVVRLVERR